MTEPDGPPQPTIVVAVGGDPHLPFRLPPLGGDVTVVAVDSGLDRLAEVGVVPHHLVGDLDSASPALVAAAEAGGAQVHRHPADKDATDLELALDLVTEELAGVDDHVLVVGAGGGRLDLLVGDALLVKPGEVVPVDGDDRPVAGAEPTRFSFDARCDEQDDG